MSLHFWVRKVYRQIFLTAVLGLLIVASVSSFAAMFATDRVATVLWYTAPCIYLPAAGVLASIILAGIDRRGWPAYVPMGVLASGVLLFASCSVI